MCTRAVFPKAFTDCAQSSSGEVEGGSHSRALGFTQAVHREACASCRRSYRQGCRAESNSEVAQAEQRLVLLQAEAVATTRAVVPEPAQVKELQTQIDLLVRERDALKSATGRQVGGGEGNATWIGSGPPCVENIPPMPTFDLQDLEREMCDRNCDLRNAMEFGDSSLISKIGGLVGQGAGQVEILSRDVSMDGRSKSSLMSTLIETADAKRRCVIPGIVARVSDDPSSIRVSGSQGWRSFTSRPAQETQPIGGFCRCCVDQFGSSPHPH